MTSDDRIRQAFLNQAIEDYMPKKAEVVAPDDAKQKAINEFIGTPGGGGGAIPQPAAGPVKKAVEMGNIPDPAPMNFGPDDTEEEKISLAEKTKSEFGEEMKEMMGAFLGVM